MPCTPPPPEPWTSVGARNPDLARVYSAIYRHRSRIAEWYPRVIVPQTRFCFGYGSGNLGPQRAEGLILIWKGWPHFRGRCPECRSAVLGVSGVGGLNTGYLKGICRKCALVFTRYTGGFGRIVEGVNQALRGTPYGLVGTGNPGDCKNFRPLIAVLQELGVRGLPKSLERAPNAEEA